MPVALHAFEDRAVKLLTSDCANTLECSRWPGDSYVCIGRGSDADDRQEADGAPTMPL